MMVYATVFKTDYPGHYCKKQWLKKPEETLINYYYWLNDGKTNELKLNILSKLAKAENFTTKICLLVF